MKLTLKIMIGDEALLQYQILRKFEDLLTVLQTVEIACDFPARAKRR